MYMTTNEMTHQKVLKFIARFTNNGQKKEVIDTFSNGCCYWFADILWDRFTLNDDVEECTVLYDPIINHWACQINSIIYDITGAIPVDAEYEWTEWNDFMFKDELLTKRLYRDCINFGDSEDDLV